MGTARSGCAIGRRAPTTRGTAGNGGAPSLAGSAPLLVLKLRAAAGRRPRVQPGWAVTAASAAASAATTSVIATSRPGKPATRISVS